MPKTNKEAEKAVKPAAKHAAPKKPKKTHKSLFRVVITVVVALVVIFALLTVYANTYSAVFPNTYVNGTLVSKMSDAELADFVSSVYSEEKLEDETFTFACTSQKVELEISDMDLAFDNDAYVKKIKASGKSGSPLLRGINLVGRLFTKEDVAPVMTYDAEVLAEAFDDATEGFEEDPVGHTFTIGKDSVTIHDSVDGVKADRNKAYADVEAQITALKIGTVILEPVKVSAEPLNFEEFYAWLTSDAVDAYYEKEDSKVVVRDSKPKCEVEQSVVKDAIRDLESPELTEVVIPVKTTEPENTAEKLTENLY
ncbi:MAG: peptidoglycan binding domain-containing protein, partial [Clostridia bacterium]|nr:peptidoglycan binding domain-containing protein [Clostridia bacterium]